MKRFFKYFSSIFAVCAAALFAGAGCTPAPTDTGGQPPSPEKCYYFDSGAPSGGDGTADSPYNDLAAVRDLQFGGGERVLFKRGSQFKGQLYLEGINGGEETPVVFTCYGDQALPLPSVDGCDLTGSGVLHIKNCNFVTVENLELFDSAKEEGDRRGVLIEAAGPDLEEGEEHTSEDVITYTGITVRGLYVHDIRGITDSENSGMSLASKRTGGITAWSSDGYGRFDFLTIENCKVENVDNVGISTWYKPGTDMSCKKSPYAADFAEYAHTNVLIRGNEICHIGKNAIFARNLNGGVIEYNTMYETATTCVSGNTICTSFVYGTVIQFNEGYYNRASVRPKDGKLQDGCMLDADLQSRDTVWQYNYSHDNSFGLFLNCTSYDPEKGVRDVATVRYNLSVHDQGRKGIVYVNYAAEGIIMYNNTFIVSAETNPVIIKSNAGRKFSFYNNIIYNMSKGASFDIASYGNADIGQNLVYNAGDGQITGQELFAASNADGKYLDPLFVGAYSDGISRNGREFARLFGLAEGSPALTGGRALDMAYPDFFGVPLSGVIGFCGKIS